MDNHYNRYLSYKTRIDDKLFTFIEKNSPTGLYDPMKYVLAGSGKRIRPMMVIFSCEAFGGKMDSAIDAAVAVEILHNFTLVHDDIMDNADTRRGEPTVHNKWDVSTAILAGDGLLGLSYRSLLKTNSPRIADIAKVFTEGMIDVCEGQSYDKEFEIRNDVSIDEYLMMIGMKTSRLLETCAVIGSHIAEATPEQAEAMKNYAENLGLAFQIQDDLLDIIADEKEFGKKIGGDIKEGKKTYLLLKALDLVEKDSERHLLNKVILPGRTDPITDEEIKQVKSIYEGLGIIEDARKLVESYTQKADSYLGAVAGENERQTLKWFSGMLLDRSS